MAQFSLETALQCKSVKTLIVCVITLQKRGCDRPCHLLHSCIWKISSRCDHFNFWHYSFWWEKWERLHWERPPTILLCDLIWSISLTYCSVIQPLENISITSLSLLVGLKIFPSIFFHLSSCSCHRIHPEHA